MNFNKVWDDQETFNVELMLHSDSYRSLRSGPSVAFAKEMVLNMASESDELLRTLNWKTHRKINMRPNRAHTLEELIDQFKIWMTMAQGLGYSKTEIEEAYWRKSMVVRQRMSSEWIKTLDGPIVIVDIDQVLADYITGFTSWIQDHYPQYTDAAMRLRRVRGQISCESMGVAYEEWEHVKHHFRTSGEKQRLPVMPGANAFLRWCHMQSFTVVLLTSRPIARYPNMYTDTVAWLHDNALVYDHIWWADNKADRILEGDIRHKIAFMVDDDPRFVKQAERLGISVYWMIWEKSRESVQAMIQEHWAPGSGPGVFNRNLIQPAESFDRIMDTYPRLQEGVAVNG